MNPALKIAHWKNSDRVSCKKRETVAQTEGCSYARETECISYHEGLTKSDNREAVSPEWLQAEFDELHYDTNIRTTVNFDFEAVQLGAKCPITHRYDGSTVVSLYKRWIVLFNFFSQSKTAGRDFHLQTNESLWKKKTLVFLWWTDRTQEEIRAQVLP